MNTLKAIGKTYATETFRSRPAFARYAKTSVLLQNL